MKLGLILFSYYLLAISAFSTTVSAVDANITSSSLRGAKHYFDEVEGGHGTNTNSTMLSAQSHRQLKRCYGCPLSGLDQTSKFKLISSNGKSLGALRRKAEGGWYYWQGVYVVAPDFATTTDTIQCIEDEGGWVWLRVSQSTGHYYSARNYARDGSHGMWVVETVTNQGAWERWCPLMLSHKHPGDGKDLFSFHVSMDGHNQWLRAGYGEGNVDWATITSSGARGWEEWRVEAA